MDKIKVIYVISSAGLYGDNKALLNILDGVRERVFPLVVLASKGKMSVELEKRSIDYITIKHLISIYPVLRSIKDIVLFLPRALYMIWSNYRASIKLSIVVNEFVPDLIHTNVGPIHIGFNVSRKLNVPHVWHIREYQDLDFGWRAFPSKRRFIDKLQYPNNYPIAITNGIFNYFNMLKNARVIYDGVLPKAKTQFVEVKENYFLFVGRLEEGKGIRILIEAFIEFSKFNKDFELRIAGESNAKYINKLYRIIEDADLNHRILFLGYRTDVFDLMAKATALVVPSRFEGFGLITAEAMFNSCLVIGNNSAGTREILEKDDLGILYSGHDALVSALKTVVMKGIESFYPKIRTAQLEAIKRYSQERNAEAVHKFYMNIIFQKQNI